MLTDWHCPQPLSKKIKLRAYRYRVFLQRTPHDRNLPQAKLFNRSNSFFCLKGRGSFKKSFKKCGNVEEGKAHRLIPPMTPLLNGWTIPLINFVTTPPQWWAKWRLSTFNLYPREEGHGVHGQICDILRPQLAMNRFLPLWPHRFLHFWFIHLGGGGVGGLYY